MDGHAALLVGHFGRFGRKLFHDGHIFFLLRFFGFADHVQQSGLLLGSLHFGALRFDLGAQFLAFFNGLVIIGFDAFLEAVELVLQRL